MTPQPTPQEVPTDEYDLEAPPPSATPTPAAPEPVPGIPRDPATGRFLRGEEAATLQPAGHSEKLLKRARAAGVGEDMIATLSSDQLADVTHSFLEQQVMSAKQMADYRRAVASDATVQRERGTIRRDGPGPAVGEDATRGHDALPPLDAPSVDWGEIEEDGTKKPFKDLVAPQFVKVVEDQAKRIKALESQIGALLQNEQIRQNMTAKQQFQAEFAKHPDLFGSGDPDSLDADGPEAARVQAVAGFMKSIAREKRTTFSKDFQKAVQTLFGAATKPAVEPKPPPAPQVDARWREGSAARPTQRNGAAEPASKEKAERGVRRFQQEVAEANGTIEDFDDGL